MAILYVAAEPRDRPALRRHRPPGQDGRLRTEPHEHDPLAIPPRAALAASAPRSGTRAYVVGENPVTGLAFVMFLLLVALRPPAGPGSAPYDPLASDTMAALQPPSAAHWFGTDQLGRDILSRVIAATRLDLGIAVFSVALVFALGGLAGHRRRLSSAAGPARIVGPARRHDHGLPALRARHGHRGGARQHGDQHRHRHRHHQLPALRPRRQCRGQCPPQCRLRAGRPPHRQRRVPHPARPRSCPTSCRS